MISKSIELQLCTENVLVKHVKHAILLGSESQYPGVCVLEMVIIPSFPLVVTTALCIWELSPGPWPGTGNSHLHSTVCAPG